MSREYDGVIKGSRAEEIIWDRDAEIAKLRDDFGEALVRENNLLAAIEAARTAYQRIDCTPSNIIAAIEMALGKEE